jgi:hypothetical protein
MKFIRGTESDQEAVARAAPIVTVILLCIAEFLAFAALPASVQRAASCFNFDLLALLITIHAAAVGLATLVWLLARAVNPTVYDTTGRQRGRRGTPNSARISSSP